MLTILITTACIVIGMATIGTNKKTFKWFVAIVSLIAIGILIPLINLSNTATNEEPQMIANELDIDANSVYYDKNSDIWYTDDASYRAVFTEQELIKTNSGIKVHTELKSLVKIGENVIK